ncbi:LuxR C-terminal-related transcriptional regulator [uncultured Bdellovibrio sp.]|uniref:LuxR C-terminal-related transcriptional regulator n=1 Tax=Bdellovibrio sp. HCB-162 TaxID=3394234 RepID=UPI0025CBD3AD|nr:response regulator transcription factor [uncultured Bdellovibrio sp.]
MSSEHRVGIFIVDDHAITRAALRAEIEKFSDKFYVVGEAGNESSALTQIAALKPDMVFLDHALKSSDGLRILEYLRTTPAKVFVFTQVTDPHILHFYWKNGVVALVSKALELSDLQAALHTVSAGKRYLSPNFVNIIEANYKSLLTAREIEVIRLISSGRSNKEVADVLGCTDHTIKTHKANIMEKLGFSSTVEVSVWATKNGLI